jgi:hypothetical protein
MPKNKTLYVQDADYELWDEAKRLLAYHQRKTLVGFITEKLREYVTEENARQGRGKPIEGSGDA